MHLWYASGFEVCSLSSHGEPGWVISTLLSPFLSHQEQDHQINSPWVTQAPGGKEDRKAHDHLSWETKPQEPCLPWRVSTFPHCNSFLFAPQGPSQMSLPLWSLPPTLPYTDRPPGRTVTPLASFGCWFSTDACWWPALPNRPHPPEWRRPLPHLCNPRTMPCTQPRAGDQQMFVQWMNTTQLPPETTLLNANHHSLHE